MQIDFGQKLLDLSGKPMQAAVDKDATLSSVCVEALLLTREEDKNLPVGDKLKRGKLAEKIYLPGDATNTVIEITVEEAGLLQTMVGRSYSPLVVLRAYTLLEGPTKE